MLADEGSGTSGDISLVEGYLKITSLTEWKAEHRQFLEEVVAELADVGRSLGIAFYEPPLAGAFQSLAGISEPTFVAMVNNIAAQTPQHRAGAVQSTHGLVCSSSIMLLNKALDIYRQSSDLLLPGQIIYTGTYAEDGKAYNLYASYQVDASGQINGGLVVYKRGMRGSYVRERSPAVLERLTKRCQSEVYGFIMNGTQGPFTIIHNLSYELMVLLGHSEDPEPVVAETIHDGVQPSDVVLRLVEAADVQEEPHPEAIGEPSKEVLQMFMVQGEEEEEAGADREVAQEICGETEDPEEEFFFINGPERDQVASLVAGEPVRIFVEEEDDGMLVLAIKYVQQFENPPHVAESILVVKPNKPLYGVLKALLESNYAGWQESYAAQKMAPVRLGLSGRLALQQVQGLPVQYAARDIPNPGEESFFTTGNLAATYQQTLNAIQAELAGEGIVVE